MIAETNTTTLAEDRFESYYAEKLWEMIPPIYRLEDGLATQPEVLRSLVLILAKQAAILRRSQDHLWDDTFIELCDEWVVPYIGELLGTRLVSASNLRGRRIDVAKTIYYRRRKGTLRVLEELISDITGWDGKVVEQFKRLGRARHGLDPQPLGLAGRISGTQPGGWADLRQAQSSELADGPFDEFFHTTDFRQQRGLSGRYNLPKLAFYLYRLTAYKIEDATPFPLGDGLGFSFDPSGRNIPLFNRRERGGAEVYNWENWRSAMEWELPLPIRCRLLSESNFLFSSEVIDALAASPGLSAAEEDDLNTLVGYPIRGEARLKETLAALPNGASFINPPFYELLLAILTEAIVAECGKRAILPESITIQENGSDYSFPATTSGSLLLWDTSNAPSEKELIIDPENGLFAFVNAGPSEEEELTVQYHYGFSGEIGAGPYDRRNVEEVVVGSSVSLGTTISSAILLDNGVTQIEDNRSYFGLPDSAAVENMTLQAANQTRPYIRLTQDWILDTGANSNAFLVLDGLWIGGDSDLSIILQGDYECVVIRNCTLDPGGSNDILGNPIGRIQLLIEGHVEALVIDKSITGPITMAVGAEVEEVTICDSILQSLGGIAIDLETAAACMERVTVFGATNLHTVQATEVLMTGITTVTDTQQGCFRFSAAPIGSRVPRSYPYPLKDFSTANQWFTSMVFGNPGYGQLSAVAPLEIQRGAENGSEIGAFSSLLNPIKLDSLQIKVAEYMPFGLIPMFIFET